MLAVILVVASLTLPALDRPFAKSKVRDAAKQLRVALARARLEAIRTGAPQRFRYQPGTGIYEISTNSTAEGGGFAPVAPEDTIDPASASGDTAPMDGTADASAARYALPEGIVFFDPLAPEAPPLEADTVPSETAESWSAPIVFYPNGRSFNAVVRLHGNYNYYVDVMLRGLTGASRIGEVQRAEEPEEGTIESMAEESP